jgi:hypothetical protein
MKIKENKRLYIVLFPLIFVSLLLTSIYVEHTSGIHGRGDLLAPGPLSWTEIFKNIKRYIFVNLFLTSFIYFMAFYPFKKKNKGNMIKGKYDDVKERVHNRERYSSPPNKYECRICGYSNKDYPWGEDGKSPSYQICPCCGVQFGINDITPEDMQRYFKEWEKNDLRWNNPKEKPVKWVIDEQIKNKWISKERDKEDKNALR